VPAPKVVGHLALAVGPPRRTARWAYAIDRRAVVAPVPGGHRERPYRLDDDRGFPGLPNRCGRVGAPRPLFSRRSPRRPGCGRGAPGQHNVGSGGTALFRPTLVGARERCCAASRALPSARVVLVLAATLAIAAALAGCGTGSISPDTSERGERAALESYLQQVEPIRLAVNRLLEGADPILSADHRGRISARQASLEIGGLERRFAAYTVDVAAIQPLTAQLRFLHAAYAHTYILEDAYLSALTNGLLARNVDRLPDTQSTQRAAIIQWRVGLAVLARRAGLSLPGDLQAAGRGEIAPSPAGS
jgi:hypothetical protein